MPSEVKPPTVSFVVPAFNVAPYISECLASIAAQTIRDIEIIVVDDGSTDGTAAICDAFASGDDRVFAIHTDNCGVSHARNVGLCNAVGEFVCFVDSDDWIAPEFAERMTALLERLGAGIAACGATRIGRDGGVAWRSKSTKSVFAGEAALCGVLRRDLYCGWPWNKMFRRRILVDNGILFDESLRYCEDLLFCFDAIAASGSIAYDSIEDLYFYRDSTSSVNRKAVSCGIVDTEYLRRFDADAKIIERAEKMSARVRRYARANAFASGENAFRKNVQNRRSNRSASRLIAIHMLRFLPDALLCRGFGGSRTKLHYVVETLLALRQFVRRRNGEQK